LIDTENCSVEPIDKTSISLDTIPYEKMKSSSKPEQRNANDRSSSMTQDERSGKRIRMVSRRKDWNKSPIAANNTEHGTSKQVK
jgi:hypothetical protein